MQEIMKRVNSWYLQVAYKAEIKNVLGHGEVERRLKRAYDMLTCGADEYSIKLMTFGEGSAMYFEVTSPNNTYIVTPSKQSCTCPDSEKLCKHRLAVRLILNAIRLEQNERRTISNKS